MQRPYKTDFQRHLVPETGSTPMLPSRTFSKPRQLELLAVAGFRDHVHNPFTHKYVGIHQLQKWHITCLTLRRASWSFLTMSMGSDPA
jgi:hypothetical protein